MATIHALGKIGEDYALAYILSIGFRLLDRNWRLGHLELDLVAMDHSTLVFLEVKTRSGTYFGWPEESVTGKKENNLHKAAAYYARKIDHEAEIRFDIISIIVDKNRSMTELSHIKDAFFPGP